MRFGWLKSQLDQQDYEYYDELVARLNAEGDQQEVQRRRERSRARLEKLRNG